MTTKELIAHLQRIDPSGEMRVMYNDSESGLSDVYEAHPGEDKEYRHEYEQDPKHPRCLVLVCKVVSTEIVVVLS